MQNRKDVEGGRADEVFPLGQSVMAFKAPTKTTCKSKLTKIMDHILWFHLYLANAN